MSLVLNYTRADGTLGEAVFDKDSSIINLENLDIETFDTSQLASNSRIKKISLNGNPIPRVDLTPLISCRRLKEIEIHGDTEGETILSSNSMEDISKDVVYDEISNFDALSFLPSLDSILFSLPYVRKHEPDWKLIHLFRNALVVQDLGWMGLLDIGMKTIKKYLGDLTPSGFSDSTKLELVKHLIDQIDRGGTTIDLEVEGMKQYGNLLMRIDDVVELRHEEMRGQYVPVMTFGIDHESIVLLESVGESIDTHYVDLRHLWLTAYGYEVCESLAVGTTCEMKQFPMIADALSELGFEIKRAQDAETYSVIGWRNRDALRALGIDSPEPKIKIPDNISSDMIDYIWQLADYRKSITSE